MITNCENCHSERVASLTAKCSDLCGVTYGVAEHDGYVPSDMGIGGGDYVEFDWCLDCGKIQGINRLPLSEIEQGEIDGEADTEVRASRLRQRMTEQELIDRINGDPALRKEFESGWGVPIEVYLAEHQHIDDIVWRVAEDLSL